MTQVKYPISVGLIGAPGAGKHALASLFAREFQLKTGEFVAVVESPARTIEDGYNRPMGVHGDYRDTLEAHFIRSQQEEGLRQAHESFISVGTLAENLAHGGVKVEDIRMGIATPDQQQRVMKEMHTTTVMTFLMIDSFRYTFGFYLPLKDTSDLIVPGQDSADDAYARRVDNGLRIVINNFNLGLPVLDQPTLEEKADAMIDNILQVMNPPASDDTVAE